MSDINNSVNTEATVNPAVEANVATMTAAQVQLSLAEQLIGLKYPHLQIVPGSLIQEVDHPLYKNKRRVQVVCGCGAKVERATSDLFTFIGCETCKKQVRKANKLQKKVAELQILAQAQAKVAAPGAQS